MNALKKSWMLYLCILCGWTSVSVDAKQDDKTAGRYTLSLDGGEWLMAGQAGGMEKR